MRSLIFALSFAAFAASATIAAADPQPWYVTHPHAVTTLRQAIAEDRAFMNQVNPRGYQWGQNHRADAATCDALATVALACDYDTRMTLSIFLTVNGKGLFPASGHTNPYCLEEDIRALGMPDDCFIGHGRQNAMLRQAVLRNAALFHDGDLSAADVRARWR